MCCVLSELLQGQDPRTVVRRFCQTHRARDEIFDKLCDELLERVRSVSARPPPSGGASGPPRHHSDHHHHHFDSFHGGPPPREFVPRGGPGSRHGSRAGSTGHRHSYGGGGGPRFRDSIGSAGGGGRGPPGGNNAPGGGGGGPRGDLPPFDGLPPHLDRFGAASAPPDFGGNIPPAVQGDPLAGVYPPSRGPRGQFPPY